MNCCIKYLSPLCTLANESMHPSKIFNQVEDGLVNSINYLKDWHETMLQHADSY
jgi:hypothetical protein